MPQGAGVPARSWQPTTRPSATMTSLLWPSLLSATSSAYPAGRRGQGVLRSGHRLARTGAEDESDERLVSLLTGLLDVAARLALRDLGDIAGAAADTRRALGVCDGSTVAVGRTCSKRPAATRRSRAWPGGPDRVSRRPREKQEAAKAMELLRQAVAIGFRNANLLRIESALDPLRDRADFKKLMAELEKNVPTAASEEVTSRDVARTTGRQQSKRPASVSPGRRS